MRGEDVEEAWTLSRSSGGCMGLLSRMKLIVIGPVDGDRSFLIPL